MKLCTILDTCRPNAEVGYILRGSFWVLGTAPGVIRTEQAASRGPFRFAQVSGTLSNGHTWILDFI